MTQYTTKEKDIINQAFAAIERIIDETDMTVPFEWKKALKSERTQCRSLIAAKALLVAMFTQGTKDPNTPAHEVYRYREGARMAIMVGATVKKRRTGKTLDASAALREQAIATMRAVQERAFKKLEM